MTKFGRSLPFRERVAGQAIFAELAAMLVDVAGQAIAGEAEKRPGQIFHHDGVALGHWNVVGGVALLAFEAPMTAFKRVAGLAVVKILEAGLPVDEVEIDAVVF